MTISISFLWAAEPIHPHLPTFVSIAITMEQWQQNKLITTSHCQAPSEAQAHVCYPSQLSLTPAALAGHNIQGSP